jgi:hypothetical protein
VQIEIQAKLNKIRKVSTFLRAICKGLLAFVTLLGLCCVVCVVFGVGAVNYESMVFRTDELSLGLRLLLGVVTALTFTALFKCFYHLHRLFGSYASGEIFTKESVGQLRQFGVSCLLWGVMNFLWLLSLAVSSHPGKTFLYGHADSFAIGVIIIVIAWFMEIAVDLQEENELTI